MIVYDGIRWRTCGLYNRNPEYGSLHRYIYEKFIGPIPDGWVVHHIDEDPSNNDPSNLKAMTIGDHISHHDKGNSYRKGSTHTAEAKKKISDKMKGREPWNKGLSGYKRGPYKKKKNK